MSYNQSISEKFRVDFVVFEPGIFNRKKNLALGITGFASLTALVVGILILLHGDGGLLFGTLQSGYTLVVIGSASLFVDGVVLTIYVIKHLKIKREMETVLENDYKQLEKNAQSVIKTTLDKLVITKNLPMRYDALEVKDFYIILQADTKSKSIRIFANEMESLDYGVDELENKGYL